MTTSLYTPGTMYHLKHEKLGVIYALLIQNIDREYIWLTSYGDFMENDCTHMLHLIEKQPLKLGKSLVLTLPVKGWEPGWCFQNGHMVESGTIVEMDGVK